MLVPPACANFEASVLCDDSFASCEECSEMLRFQVVNLITLNKLCGALLVGGQEFSPVHGNLLLGCTLCYTSRGLEAYDDVLAI